MPTRNFVYEVDSEEREAILRYSAISEDFINDCKRVAKKYRMKTRAKKGCALDGETEER